MADVHCTCKSHGKRSVGAEDIVQTDRRTGVTYLSSNAVGKKLGKILWQRPVGPVSRDSCDDIGGWSDCRSLYDAGGNVKEG